MELGLSMVSYTVLGFLFFAVIMSMSQEVLKGFGHSKFLGYLISISIASYGFWFPFIPALRSIYLGFIICVAIAGIFSSRMAIVLSRSSSRLTVYGVILFLLLFDVGHWIFFYQAQRFYEAGGTATIITIVSWGIFVYGMYELNKGFFGPVIQGMELPFSNFVIFAFFLASVISVPLEFPQIYIVMVIAAVAGTVAGFILQARYKS
ncbi:MAG: hypothetical protein PVF58_06105 [Candidatus Methanofastidiosia archaeon]|jgi:hypothetical protein